MRKPRKAHHFYSDLYHQNFFFLYGWSREQVEKFLALDTGGAQGITLQREEAVYIWVECLEGEGISHLCHEAVHGANFVLESRGVKISAKNDEPQAYLVQWIFLNCQRGIKGKRK